VDLNSGFELAPGLKDISALKAFKEKLKKNVS
jgi:phosphoribosylanthranilate isomerase